MCLLLWILWAGASYYWRRSCWLVMINFGHFRFCDDKQDFVMKASSFRCRWWLQLQQLIQTKLLLSWSADHLLIIVKIVLQPTCLNNCYEQEILNQRQKDPKVQIRMQRRKNNFFASAWKKRVIYFTQLVAITTFNESVLLQDLHNS